MLFGLVFELGVEVVEPEGAGGGDEQGEGEDVGAFVGVAGFDGVVEGNSGEGGG